MGLKVNSALVALVTILGLLAPTASAAFIYGDVLVTDFNGFLYQLRADGTFVRSTSLNNATQWVGNAFTSDGNVVVTSQLAPPRASLYDANGTRTSTFTCPEVTSGKDVSVMPDGVLAVCDNSFAGAGPGKVEFYSRTGVHLQTAAMPSLSGRTIFGSTVSSDGSLLVCDFGASRLVTVHEDGTVVSDIGVPFKPFDCVVDPLDDTLWMSALAGASNKVEHITSAGAVLSSFTVVFPAGNPSVRGIALATDGSLLVSSNNDSTLLRYSKAGSLLQSINVPGATSLELMTVVVPEPSMVAMFAIAAVSVFVRRR